VFSIERTFQVPNGQFRTFTQRIVGKEALDAHTLRLKTATPYAMVPYDLNSVFIVSRKAAPRSGPEDFDSGKAMIGTGPSVVRFARGDRVELAATTTIGERRVEKARPGRRSLSASCPPTRRDSPASSPETSTRSIRSPLRTCRASGATPGCRRRKRFRGARFSSISISSTTVRPGSPTRPAGP